MTSRPMTNKQELREAAEKATCGNWCLQYGEDSFDADDALILREASGYLPICKIEGAHPESGFYEDFQQEQQANAEFIAATNPAAVLALLDELEAKDRMIAELLNTIGSHTVELGWGEKPITLAELIISREGSGSDVLDAIRTAGIRINGEG